MPFFALQYHIHLQRLSSGEITQPVHLNRYHAAVKQL